MILGSLRFVCAGLVLLFGQTPAMAWQPQGPVRIVVPFAAGGPTDTIARILATEMADALKTEVFVDNISGAGGKTGVKRFLAEAQDGHTLLMGHMGTHGSAPALNAELGYDPILDFAPVGLAAGTPIIITVALAVPAGDLNELAALMRTKGGDIRVAHAGRGSVSHSGALLLSSTFNAHPTFVTYAGTAPALNDLVAGKVDVLVDQVVNIAPASSARKVRALAVAAEERLETLPDIASTGELGVPMKMDAWNGLFAKAGTPPDQVAALHRAVRYALNNSRCRARLLDLGAVLPDEEQGTPAALAGVVREEIARWSATLFELRK